MALRAEDEAQQQTVCLPMVSRLEGAAYRRLTPSPLPLLCTAYWSVTEAQTHSPQRRL